jgi:hypothetical protein
MFSYYHRIDSERHWLRGHLNSKTYNDDTYKVIPHHIHLHHTIHVRSSEAAPKIVFISGLPIHEPTP